MAVTPEWSLVCAAVSVSLTYVAFHSRPYTVHTCYTESISDVDVRTKICKFLSIPPPFQLTELGVLREPAPSQLEPALWGAELAVFYLCWSRSQQGAAQHAGREASRCVTLSGRRLWIVIQTELESLSSPRSPHFLQWPHGVLVQVL